MRFWLVCIVFLVISCGSDDQTPTQTPDSGVPNDGDVAVGADVGADEGVDMPPEVFRWDGAMLVATDVGLDYAELSWSAPIGPASIESYELFRDGVSVQTFEATTTEFRDEGLQAGTDYAYELWATDSRGVEISEPLELTVTTMTVTPPDPADTTPDLDPQSFPGFADRVGFLWQGEPRVQTDVVDGAIDSERVSIVRGRVLDEAGDPIVGATIRVSGAPELGKTLTRVDGRFDFAFNAGGRVTFDITAPNRLPSQRSVTAQFNDWVQLEDVVLIARDPNGTPVTFGSSTGQLASSSEVTDQSGARTPRVYIPPMVGAEMLLDDGTTQALTDATVRITEYTVGDNATERMPGALPETSAYTHAVELELDQAVDAGAVRVNFDSPVFYYVENFMGFPAGGDVPVGSYDRAIGQWIPEPDGRIIEIVAVNGGVAEVDIDGDGAADNMTDLETIGLTSEELGVLGATYTAGDTIWRAPVAHFTPWDLNWPYTLPNGSRAPDGSLIDGPPAPHSNPCEEDGSIVKCQSRTLGQRELIRGTGESLVYDSSRSASHALRQRTLRLQVMETVPPEPPKRVEVIVDIAGQLIKRSLQPSANLQTTIIWDGLDGFEQPRFGPVSARVIIRHVYPAVFIGTNEDHERTFARLGDYDRIIADSDRMEINIDQQFVADFNHESFDARVLGLGGWGLSRHHHYDPNSGQIFFGDGGMSSANIPTVRRFAGVVQPRAPFDAHTDDGDGGPARDARIVRPSHLDVGPDGTLYIKTSVKSGRRYRPVIRKVDRDGTIHRVAGGGFGDLTGPAAEADLDDYLRQFAVRSDGSLLIVSRDNQIYEVNQAGDIEHFAGSGDNPLDANGQWTETAGPASTFNFGSIVDIEVAPDGVVYVAVSFRAYVNGMFTPYQNRIFEVRDGFVTTMMDEEGTLDATRTEYDASSFPLGRMQLVHALAMGPDGTLYVQSGIISQPGQLLAVRNGQVRVITGVTADPNFEAPGPASAFDFNELGVFNFSSIAAHPNGTIYFGGGRDAIMIIAPDGRIGRAVATPLKGVYPPPEYQGDGGRLDQLIYSHIGGMAIGPNGHLYISDTDYGVVRQVRDVTPGLTAFSTDGDERYEFAGDGRHLETYDSMTGLLKETFDYDSEGRLLSVTNSAGQVMTIERAADGTPTAIVGYGGERTVLTLDANGWLSEIVHPDGATVSATYTQGGLMETYDDARGRASSYTWSDAALTSHSIGGATATLQSSQPSPGVDVVTYTNLEGDTTNYTIESTFSGGTITTTSRGGQSVVVTEEPGGPRRVDLPDGSSFETFFTADPRGWASNGLASTVTTTTSSGLSKTTTFEYAAELQDPNDISSGLVEMTVDVTSGTDSANLSYSGATRTSTVTHFDGRVSTIVHDTEGRLSSAATSPNGSQSSYTWSASGELTGITAAGISTTFSQNLSTNTFEVTDGVGDTTTYTENGEGWVSSIEFADGTTLGLDHDAVGNPTIITMPDGDVHNLTYDGPFVASYQAPGASAQTFTYDAMGELERVDFPDGTMMTRTLDADGRLASWNGSTETLSHTYDSMTGELTSSEWTPAAGVLQSYSVVRDGPLVTARGWTGPATGAYAYRWTADYEMAGMTFETEPERAYVRNASGELAQHGPFVLSRNSDGQVTAITDGTASFTPTYDTDGWHDGAGLSVGSFTWNYVVTRDAAGRVSSITETGATSRLREFSYDSLGQLVGVDVDGVPTHTYAYDTNRNRTNADGAASTYAAGDVLTDRGGTTYVFDDNGRLESRGSETFDYSQLGRLLSWTDGTTTIDYAYDYHGRRVARTAGTDKTEFFYGHPDNAVLLTASRGPEGLSEYFYDENGRLVGITRAGTLYYVASDHLGSPRFVVDSVGTVVKEIDYDPWGRVVVDTAPGFPLHVGYAGALQDPDTGLSHFLMRDYDPESGRFVARDPILFYGESINLFAYVDNDPVSHTDPVGLMSFEAGANVVVGLKAEASIDGTGATSFCLEGTWGAAAKFDFAFNPSAKARYTGRYNRLEAKAAVAGFGLKHESRVWTEMKCPDGRTIPFDFWRGTGLVENGTSVVTPVADVGLEKEGLAPVASARTLSDIASAIFQHANFSLDTGVGATAGRGGCFRFQLPGASPN